MSDDYIPCTGHYIELTGHYTPMPDEDLLGTGQDINCTPCFRLMPDDKTGLVDAWVNLVP